MLDSSRSSTVAGDSSAQNAPALPKDAEFNDDSKVPFLTARTFIMAILVSMGGICFGYDTGQISGFLEVGQHNPAHPRWLSTDKFRWITSDTNSPTIARPSS